MDEAVRRAAVGDADSFSALVEPEIEDLRRLAMAIVLDRQVADDVVQDSLLAAWRRVSRLREPASFRVWLRRIVVNRSRNASRRPRALRLLDVTADKARHAGDPADAWADAVALEAAMRELTVDQRVCVALYYLEGRPVSAIAALLGVPEGTVKSRLHSARAQLREALQ